MRREAGHLIAAAMMVALYSGMYGCSPPDDSDPSNIIGTDPCSDPWRGDTALIRSTIRFEALVDTLAFPIQQFSGSGLRISLVLIPPPEAKADTLPFRSMVSYSANYLDIPAVSLPLRSEIPPAYFRQHNCARMAVAAVLLHRDDNGDERFTPGEAILGACEQSLYAFAQGDMRTVPKPPFETIFEGNNILIRNDGSTLPAFRSSPDYHATIFILHVRGEAHRYNIPYPWPGPALP
jgi:hypothetical protein